MIVIFYARHRGVVFVETVVENVVVRAEERRTPGTCNPRRDQKKGDAPTRNFARALVVPNHRRREPSVRVRVGRQCIIYLPTLPKCCLYPLSWSQQVSSTCASATRHPPPTGTTMPPRLSTLDTLQSTGDETNDEDQQQVGSETSPSSRLWRWAKVAAHHLKHHVGVGIICSVAYFDP